VLQRRFSWASFKGFSVISLLLQKILRIYQDYISGLSWLLQKILVIFRTRNSIYAQYPNVKCHGQIVDWRYINTLLLLFIITLSAACSWLRFLALFLWTSVAKKEPIFPLLVYL